MIGLFGIIKNELKKQDKLPAKYEGITFPLQTIPKMTSNTKPEGQASSSSYAETPYKAYYAYLAFSGDSDGARSARSGLTLTYTYSSLQSAGTYICSFNSGSSTYRPRQVTIALQKEDDTWVNFEQITVTAANRTYNSSTKKVNYKFKAIKFTALPEGSVGTHLKNCQCTRMS